MEEVLLALLEASEGDNRKAEKLVRKLRLVRKEETP